MLKRNYLLAYFVLLFLILLVWGLFLQFSSLKTTFLNYAFNLGYGVIYLSAGVIALNFTKLLNRNTLSARGLFFIGLGNLSYALGLIIWAFYNLFLKVNVPYPSLADLFFLLFYPLLVVGILITLRIYSLIISQRVIIEAVIVAIIALFAVFLLNSPDISPDLGLIPRIFNLAYPISDVLIISLIYIAIRVSSGKMNLGLILFSVGLVFQTVGDMFFAYRTNNNLYWNGDISDLMFALSAFCIGVGIVYIVSDLDSLSKRATT